MIIEKIDKEAENGAFEMAFRDGNWGLHPEEVLPIFKALIKRHNDMVDLVNKLSIHIVSNTEGECCDNPTLELGAIPEHKFCGKCGQTVSKQHYC